MKRQLATVVVGALSCLARPAWPCGGGFGQGIEIAPAQTIVVAFDGTTETYVFRPHFCGAATSFGLILPVPATLSASPTIASSALFDELEALTAPQVVTECESAGGGCGAAAKGDALGADHNSADWNPGVDVVDAGTVGIFDWTLLQADTTTAFTDWLDANSFPWDSTSTPAFTYYVDRSWYFVAFKVTAGASAPPSGSKLCGDLGPVSVQFATSAAVVPARIATVNRSLDYSTVWRVISIATDQVRVAGGFYAELRYAGTLTDEDLGELPSAGGLATAGARVTKLDVTFMAETNEDIRLTVEPNPQDFRQQVVVYEECGCAAATNGFVPVVVVIGLVTQSLAFVARRRRRAPAL